MPATYEPIATVTFNGSVSEATFTSIPNTFTDLRVVFVGSSSTQSLCFQYNSDTGNNYSIVALRGDGSTATNYSNNNINRINAMTIYSTYCSLIADIFSYTGSTYKSSLIEANEDANGSGYVRRICGLWRSTSAITSIRLFGFSAANITGTATLYGIKAA